MPYKVGTTPRRLRGKGIPQKFMNVFINSYNAKYKETGDEGRALTYAYGSMNKALHNAGYRKSAKTGKWSKSHEALEAPTYYEESMGRRIVLEEGASLDDALREGLTFKGIALIDHAVSQLGTGYERYYSPEFNDLCMENTKKFMRLGHTVTTYNKHASASGGLFSPSTENPIGKVSNLRREDNMIVYDEFISPTVKGREVIQLIFDEVMGETSVRMLEVQSLLHRLVIEGDGNEEDEDYGFIEEMISARIAGIDLCDEAGITGAGIVRVQQEGMRLAPHTEPEEVDMEFNWEELTIDELLEHRRDLVDAHVATQLEVLTAQLTTNGEELAAVQAELENAKAALVAQPMRIEELELQLAVEQAAQGSVGKEIVKALKGKVTSREQIPELASAARERAIAVVLSSGSSGPTNAKGTSKLPIPDGDDDSADDQATEPEYTEEQVEMMRLVQGPTTRR